MTLTRTSLTPHIGSMRDPDAEGARKFAKAKMDDGWIIVHTSWCKGWAQRQQAIQLGELVHGKRSAK